MSTSLEAVLSDERAFFNLVDSRAAQIAEYAWNRTTNFDALARGGVLHTDGVGFRPDRAYLAGSAGPATGFARVWGISVTPSNADPCEALLRKWTNNWSIVAHRVGVDWIGEPYDSADLENALCVLKRRR
jgi:hypothetical protein